ncbi:MAG: crossover junction endodeoxyribonuclease RuvC [Candidatus Omnitrophica bacterium]|nr:crossover junction endodeoxyribonuclease RuvC [Candidatus Omnitrophota bacterium]
MRILGVDPGLRATGFGLVEVKTGNLKILDAGSIEPHPKALFEDRIAKVHELLSGIISEHKPEVLVLEKLYAHYKHPTTACLLGHVRGVICLLAHEHKIELIEQPVKRIRLALVGNGNATKEQVQMFVKRLLHIENAKLTLDTSDALALALGQAHMLKFQLV